jgi:hypothetical protein
MATIKKTFKLYLSPWQSRFVLDFLPKKIRLRKLEYVEINPGVIQCPTSYLIPPDGLSIRDWVLYLTDEQMNIVKDKFNLKSAIHVININEKLIKDKAVVFK